jgi:hypothetical protein
LVHWIADDASSPQPMLGEFTGDLPQIWLEAVWLC